MEKSAFQPSRISAETTPFFYSEHEALRLLRSVRWPEGIRCPRCGSANVREVKTSRVLEALSCRECRYNFSTASATHFHGARIPAHVHLQLIASVAAEPDSSAIRISRLLAKNAKTISRQLPKLLELTTNPFHRGEGYQTFECFTNVSDYLEQPAISVSVPIFRDLIRPLLVPPNRMSLRKPRAPSKAKLRAEIGNLPTLPSNVSLVSPSTLPFVTDGRTANALFESIRWKDNVKTCPRCASPDLHTLKRTTLRELYRCNRCTYMFNSLAGTIFKGTKLDLNKHFQFYILYNALGNSLMLRKICELIGCTDKTASLWVKRAKELPLEQFAYIGPKAQHLLREAQDDEPFLAYCDFKGIVVDEQRFLQQLRNLCQTLIED